MVTMFRLVEIGPFGCRIERGKANSLDELPEGYEISKMDVSTNTEVVYIEPVVERKVQKMKSR